MELERKRALRLAREQADEALASSERSANILQKRAVAEASERAVKMAERTRKESHASLTSSVEAMKAEAGRLVDVERVYAAKQAQAELEAREVHMLFRRSYFVFIVPIESELRVHLVLYTYV
jgi:hypothetical protein